MTEPVRACRDPGAGLVNVAIYDLDGTVTRRPTFTPFLLFAARRHERWRLALAPVWFGAMVLYKAGLFSRRTLKQFGLRLFLGKRITAAKLEAICRSFADYVVQHGLSEQALQAIEADREQGCTLVLATAAMEVYAAELGRRLGFEHVVASRIGPLRAEPSACTINGDNCYGAQKLSRVEELFSEQGWCRSRCDVRFATDSMADGPLLAWADRAVLVNGGPLARRFAKARGWATARFD